MAFSPVFVQEKEPDLLPMNHYHHTLEMSSPIESLLCLRNPFSLGLSAAIFLTASVDAADLADHQIDPTASTRYSPFGSNDASSAR